MVNQLYHTWFRQVSQLWSKEHLPRLRTLTWMLVGIYLSRSVHLPDIAGKIPGQATTPSKTRRLERCLSQTGWSARTWYAPIARSLLRTAAETTGEIRLIVDGTKISAHHQLLLVALAYRQRALPLIWTWVPYEKGHSPVAQQQKLLAALYKLVPPAFPVVLVGDTEFGAVELLRQLEAWPWQYVLRQKGATRIRLPGLRYWQAFQSWVLPRGVRVWAVGAHLTEEHQYRTNLLGDWQATEPEPWLLATNLPTLGEALRAYRRRMWIEELFGDLKEHGFDLERTRLRHVARLSRLTLLVALLYLWLILVGQRSIRHGQRHLVDRRDRRDLSLFQIGLRMIQRWLINEQHFAVHLLPGLT